MNFFIYIFIDLLSYFCVYWQLTLFLGRMANQEEFPLTQWSNEEWWCSHLACLGRMLQLPSVSWSCRVPLHSHPKSTLCGPTVQHQAPPGRWVWGEVVWGRWVGESGNILPGIIEHWIFRIVHFHGQSFFHIPKLYLLPV